MSAVATRIRSQLSLLCLYETGHCNSSNSFEVSLALVPFRASQVSLNVQRRVSSALFAIHVHPRATGVEQIA